MMYLIAEIVFCLLAAAAIGFLIGWLMKGFLARTAQPELAFAGAVPLRAHDDSDDLKKIPGIGEVLETRLNSLGIYTFREIANWNEQKIRESAAKIGPFKGRIRRDNWIGSAKDLHHKKYDEDV